GTKNGAACGGTITEIARSRRRLPRGTLVTSDRSSTDDAGNRAAHKPRHADPSGDRSTDDTAEHRSRTRRPDPRCRPLAPYPRSVPPPPPRPRSQSLQWFVSAFACCLLSVPFV